MVSCFERIQKFILTENRVDSRQIESSDGSIATSNESPIKEKLQVDITPLSADNAITLSNAKFSWPGCETPVLQQISTSIAHGKLTMVIGPVGCGKTTFLKALLGEIAPSEGSVLTAKNNFAYCDQSPWIFEGTLKENIVGFSEFDQAWYDTVLHACALDEDITRFPAGHETMLGGQGLNLSGGQKQRVVCISFPYFNYCKATTNVPSLLHVYSLLDER
jgi:ATP-binding cassette, subfamily C (CFTR/MRP), member 1